MSVCASQLCACCLSHDIKRRFCCSQAWAHMQLARAARKLGHHIFLHHSAPLLYRAPAGLGTGLAVRTGSGVGPAVTRGACSGLACCAAAPSATSAPPRGALRFEAANGGQPSCRQQPGAGTCRACGRAAQFWQFRRARQAHCGCGLRPTTWAGQRASPAWLTHAAWVPSRWSRAEPSIPQPSQMQCPVHSPRPPPAAQSQTPGTLVRHRATGMERAQRH